MSNSKEDQKEKDLEELIQGISELSEMMEKRLRDKFKKGSEGWKERSLENLGYKLEKAVDEIKHNPTVDIDIANWCLIHYLNRRK